MFWNYDPEKFALEQLPPLLRNKRLYALIKVFLTAVTWVYQQFTSYKKDVDIRMAGRGLTAGLEHYLNGILKVPEGTIRIEDYRSENVYLHRIDELADDVYVGLDTEGDALILSSLQPESVDGGFKVMVPSSFNSSQLNTVRIWVEYYKYAGTKYLIETYE